MILNKSLVANYADDNSPFACAKDISNVIFQLEEDSNTLFEWVKNNGLKANPDKFHIILNDTMMTSLLLMNM